MRQLIVDNVVRVIEETQQFKKVYKNVAPDISAIKNFPTAAVIYPKEKMEREYISGNNLRYNGELVILIINKATNRSYDDIISDLIDLIQDRILNDEWLTCNLIDCYITEMERDGGLLYPISAAELTVELRYSKKA